MDIKVVLLNGYSPNSVSVWSTKYSKLLERSIMPEYVSVEDKIIGIQEHTNMMYKVVKSAVQIQ